MASEERQMDAYCTKLETDNERLRGALQEICAVDKAAPDRKDCHIWADMLAIASYALTGRDSFMSLDELAGAADQPSAATENPEAMYSPVAREGHAGASARQIDVAAGAPPSACNHFPGQSTCEWCGAVQPERCCLDYPRCDCNSPPEPDDDWLCFQRPTQPKVTP